MAMSRWLTACCGMGLLAALSGCQSGTIGEGPDGPAGELPAGETLAEGTSLDALFASAATQYDVPARLLKSIAWTETRGQMIVGEQEFDGQAAAHGLMALRGERLDRGALLAGLDADAVRSEPKANITAAAALLSAAADEQGIDRDDLGDWARAVAAFSGIESLAGQIHYVHEQVYDALRTGVHTEMLILEPDEKLVAKFLLPDGQPSSGPDYAGALWRPSPNYSSRPSGKKGDPSMVIIHSCEGSYAGCWSWLTNKSSGVSAHYVVNDKGSEISQLVRENKKAWHIGASYKCSLNSSTSCDLNGYGSNNFTVGIEHAGYAKQSSWDSGLLHSSAKLSCDISKYWGIPRDKYHIVGHGQLQPYNRIDPGPNWPWGSYLGLIADYCSDQAPEPPPEPPPPEPDPDPEPEPEPDPPPPPPEPQGFDLIVDSNNGYNSPAAACDVSGSWTASKNVAGYHNTGYWWRSTGASSDLALFKAYLPAAKTVTVQAWWPAAYDRSKSAPFIIFDGNGTQLDIVYVNQQSNGSKWVTLGTYALTAGWNTVALSRWTTPGYVVVADAVRFVEQQ